MLLDESASTYRFEDDDAWHARLRMSAIPHIAPVDIARWIDGVLEPEPRGLSTPSLQKHIRLPLVRVIGTLDVYGTSPASLLATHVAPYGMLVERCVRSGVYSALDADQYERLDGSVRILDASAAEYVCTFIAYVGLGARDIPTAPPTGHDGVLTRFANTWLVQPFDSTMAVEAPGANVALELDALLAARSTDDLETGVVVRALATTLRRPRRGSDSAPPASTTATRPTAVDTFVVAAHRPPPPQGLPPPHLVVVEQPQRLLRLATAVPDRPPHREAHHHRTSAPTESSLWAVARAPPLPQTTTSRSTPTDVVVVARCATARRSDDTTVASVAPAPRLEEVRPAVISASSAVPRRDDAAPGAASTRVSSSKREETPFYVPQAPAMTKAAAAAQAAAIAPAHRQQHNHQQRQAPIVVIHAPVTVRADTSSSVNLERDGNAVATKRRSSSDIAMMLRPAAPPSAREAHSPPPPQHHHHGGGRTSDMPPPSGAAVAASVAARHSAEDAVPPSVAVSDIAHRMTERTLRQEIAACAQAQTIAVQAQAVLRSDLDALDTISIEQGAAIERASQLAASTMLVGELAAEARTLAQAAHARVDEVWSNVVVTVDRLRDVRTEVLASANAIVASACTAAHADLGIAIAETIDLSIPPRIEDALNARAAAWTAMATTASLDALPFPAATATRRSDGTPPALLPSMRALSKRSTAHHPVVITPRLSDNRRTDAVAERVPSAGGMATVLSRAAESRVSTNVLREARALTLDLLLDIDTSRLRDAGGMLLSRDNIKRLGITTDDLVEGSYLFYSTVIALRDVRANVDVRELADAGHLTVSRVNMARQGIQTDDIVEGSTNGYYTEARFDQSYARADERNQAMRASSQVASRREPASAASPPTRSQPRARSPETWAGGTARSQLRRDDAVADRPPMHVQTRGIEVRLDALVGETRRRFEALDGNVQTVLSHAAVVALGLATGEDVIEGAAGPFATRLRIQAAATSRRTPDAMPNARAVGRPLPAAAVVAIAPRAAVTARTVDAVDARRFDRLVAMTAPPTTRAVDAIAPFARAPPAVTTRPPPPSHAPPPQPVTVPPRPAVVFTPCKGRAVIERNSTVVPFAHSTPPRPVSTELPLASPRASRNDEAVPVTTSHRIKPPPSADTPPPSRDAHHHRAAAARDVARPELLPTSRPVRARDTAAVGERDDNLRFSQARSQALGEVVRRLGLTVGEARHAFAQLDETVTTRVALAVQSAESTRAKMDAVDAVVASFETTVQTLIRQDVTFELRVANVAAHVVDVASSVAELDARTAADAVRVTSLHADLEALAESITVSNEEIDAIARRVDVHMALPAQVAALQTTTRASAERIVELRTAQLDAVVRLDDVEGLVRAHTASIANAHLETADVRATTLAQAAHVTSLRADLDAGMAGTHSNVARLMAHDIVLDDALVRVDAELGSATGRIHVLEVGARASLARDNATLVDVTELFDTTAGHLTRLDAHAQGLDALERVVGRTVDRQYELIDEVTLARTSTSRGRPPEPPPLPPPRGVATRDRPPLLLLPASHRACDGPTERRMWCALDATTCKASPPPQAPQRGDHPIPPHGIAPPTRPAPPPAPPPGGRARHRPELPSRVEIVGYEWSLVQHGIGDLTLRVRSPTGTPIAQSVRVVFGDGDIVESPMLVVGAEATAVIRRRRLTRESAMMEVRAVSSAGISRTTAFEPGYASFVDLVDLSASSSFVARVGRELGLGGVAVVRDGRLYHQHQPSTMSYVVFSLGRVQGAHVLTLEFPRADSFCAQARNSGRGGLWLNPAGRGWLDACAGWVRAFGETPTLDGDPCLLRCDPERMACTLGLAQTNPDGFSGELMIAMAFADVDGGWCIPRLVN